MKKYIAASFLVVLCTLGTFKLNSAPVTHPAGKECSECGCSGPGKDGACPDEKEKTCHCKK